MRHTDPIAMTHSPLLPHRVAVPLFVLACAIGPATAADTPPHHPARLQRLARLEAPPARPRRANPAQAMGARTAADGANPCLSLLSDDPASAADYAEDWAKKGGGDAAGECAALADVALGNPAAGAASLDALSQQAGLPSARRALLADQASQSWLLAAQPDHALASARVASALDPGNGDLLVDRARAAIADGQPGEAVSDLAPVLAAHADRADALVVRATAFRTLNRITEARSDIEAACARLPDEPDALLERGILRERSGDLDGARSDWSRILSVSPDTHEADLAQQDLALLDAGPEAR